MSLPRSAAFCWNGEPRDAAFFLEEALAEWSASGLASPLLVDFQPKKNPGLSIPLRPGRDLPSGGLRLLGGSETPHCRAADLAQAYKDAEKRGKADFFEDRLIVILPERGAALPLAGCFDETLFLAPAAKESVASLYETALAMNALKGRNMGISVAVSGPDKIESAAEFFLNAMQELSGLSLLNAEIRFAGHLRVPEDKAALARQSGKSYRQLFARDGFYGQLKAIGRRWIPHALPAPGFASFAQLAESVSALAGKAS